MTQWLQFRFCATKYMVWFLLSLVFSILKFIYKDLKVKAVELIAIGNVLVNVPPKLNFSHSFFLFFFKIFPFFFLELHLHKMIFSRYSLELPFQSWRKIQVINVFFKLEWLMLIVRDLLQILFSGGMQPLLCFTFFI